MARRARGAHISSSRLKSLAPLVLCLCVYLVWPAHALAQALLRIVHAVPGAGTATVDVTSGSKTTNFGSIGFAQSTAWHTLPAGHFLWRLTGSGGKTLASGSSTIGNGAYTAVVLDRTQGVVLGIYRDRAGEPGKSLIRVIHAAPEFGSPMLEFDSHVVARRLDFAQATPYLTVSPGTHSLSAMGAGHPAPMLSLRGVRLQSGVAYTEIVVGSRGQQVRVVTLIDRGAPLTRPGPTRPDRTGDATPPAAGSPWITVQPGDSLWKIARARVGPNASAETIWHELVSIWDANASRIGTGDPNLIFPGTRLHIPR